MEGSTAITPELLARVMTLAGQGAPPIEWQLIRHARVDLALGRWRRAVLDAGTAAELALTHLIDKHLAIVPETVTAALMDRYRTLGGRVDLACRLNLDVPTGLREGLIAPRNIAAHAGSPLTVAHATTAVALAAAIAETSCPRAGL